MGIVAITPTLFGVYLMLIVLGINCDIVSLPLNTNYIDNNINYNCNHENEDRWN